MYQPQIGDRVKYTGYTPEAYRNGSVPTFLGNEGIVVELEGKLYLKLDDDWILPLYYLDNIELIQAKNIDKEYKEVKFIGSKKSIYLNKKTGQIKNIDPTDFHDCYGCDYFDNFSGTPAHCLAKECYKDQDEELKEHDLQEESIEQLKPRSQEKSFFDNRINTCKHYSDYNQCAMGHYDEDHDVYCAVCMICDDYKPKEEKTRPIRRT